MRTPTVPTHRERLLREGMRQLYARGFHGTTVDGLLAATGVPKGSFYHHFGSKEEFTRQVLDRYMRFQRELLGRWSERAELSTPEALAGYFREMADGFIRSEHRRGCLFGKLSTEVAADHEEFRERLGADLAGWKRGIVELLEGGQRRGDVRADRPADALADGVLALVQGAFVIALTSRDDASLDAVHATIELLIAIPGAPSPSSPASPSSPTTPASPSTAAAPAPPAAPSVRG
jgi:TetR/AcrR family transcriptional regulator, transcriptional repressor for nem operon